MRPRWNRTSSSNSTPPDEARAGGATSAGLAALLRLPLLSQGAGALHRSFLTPDGAPPVDFRHPEGMPALCEPDSVSWQIYKNPVTLFVGGVAAVLLELGEPRVRHGVWTFSDFRHDPVARLRRTGLAAMVTVYGPEETARRMIAGIVQRHETVEGVAEDGRRYRANDPALLDWVQLTAAYGFATARDRFVAPLSAAAWDSMYREAAPAAELYGAVTAPRTKDGAEAMLDGIGGTLTPSPVLGEFLSLMRSAPIVPLAGRGLQRLLVKAALTLVPLRALSAMAMDASPLSLREARLVRTLARTMDRVAVSGSPPTESCRRLGLPAKWLYHAA